MLKRKRYISDEGGFPPSFPPSIHKKLMVLLSIILFSVALFIPQLLTIKTQSDTIGTIKITINNEGYYYDYKQGDSFVKILSANHYVVISGGILYSIDTIETDFRSSYIAIYFNEDYSQFGVLSLPLCNKCTYEFKKIKIN